MVEAEIAPPPKKEYKYVVYKDSAEAMAEVVLDGGEGDPVTFWKVREGSKAEAAGIRKGDELVQVNKSDPAVLFWKPAVEILPGIWGPVILCCRDGPEQKPGEKTRMMRRKDKDDDEWVEPPYPVSRAIKINDDEWQCGSCGVINFDHQEFCRRCGLRDSRLPKRPGGQPIRDPTQKHCPPPLIYPPSGLKRRDLAEAMLKGHLQNESQQRAYTHVDNPEVVAASSKS